MNDFRILSARREYQFRPDHVRLTVLTLSEVRDQIRASLGFQSARVEAPQPTFGPVPDTQPPGLVFEYGECKLRDGRTVPIRFLYVESQRIVIDVAGPSQAIDEVYRRFQAAANKRLAADGSRPLSDAIQLNDLSQVTARLDVDIRGIIEPSTAAILRAGLRQKGRKVDGDLGLSITSQIVTKSGEFAGEADLFQAHLAPRAGYPLSDRVFFSSAPLTTDDHREYLLGFEKALRRDQAPARRQLKT